MFELRSEAAAFWGAVASFSLNHFPQVFVLSKGCREAAASWGAAASLSFRFSALIPEGCHLIPRRPKHRLSRQCTANARRSEAAEVSAR